MALAVETATVIAETGQAMAVTPATVSVPAAAETPAYGPAEAADAASALLMARLQNRRIEDLSARTEFSTSFVDPDGSVTETAYAGPIRFKDESGQWKSNRRLFGQAAGRQCRGKGPPA
ncbi:hypothetical protein [Streptomyces mirabilis]|uniref:hypothetical protein n=1 Tax=Streptomyces mirabilis TaxID=68239 RepID=UPI0033BB7249